MFEKRKLSYWPRILLPITGAFALVWFLVRVIPKPSRATYPCQRAAFPLASAFVIWLIGVCGTVLAARRSLRCYATRHYRAALLSTALTVLAHVRHFVDNF